LPYDKDRCFWGGNEVLCGNEEMTSGTDFDALQKRYWEWLLREYPELSTWTGDDRYNDRFTDLSFEAIERRNGDERRMLDEVGSIEPSRLSGQDVLSHALLLWDLSLAVEAQQFPPVMFLTQISGPQLSFPQLVSVSPFRTKADYDNYLERLDRFPLYLEQVIALLRRGIETGWVQPSGPLASVPDQISGQLDPDIELSPLYTPLKRIPESVAPGEAERFRSRARTLLGDAIFPAMARFRDFIIGTYLPAGGREIGASALPDGDAYYPHCIREHITMDLDPGTIHQTGIEEVKRIRSRMESVMEETGFEGPLHEFAEFLRTDPKFYFSRPEDLVTAYRDIAKRADAELPLLFAELPRTPYGVRTFPDYEAPGQTTAMYYPGASDGSRAGYFMVNTYRLDMRPKYEMEALTLHEAVPGHHLQIARAQELHHLPDFRRNASYNAYIEGWALYAEGLGKSMGFYTDPYALFGQLTYEMWRACRLVVDTGLHSFGWTRQQAIEYMRENTAKTEQDIAVEVDRYIVLPGQALSYKIGELKIKELRAKAERELGEAFDVRRFHNAILDNGPLPLTLLAEQIGEWIRTEKTAQQEAF
jgi:uncharacterized protein (DUF885 family)